MTKSIQSRLALALTTAAVLLSATTGIILYRVVGSTMRHNFDRALLTKGQAVVSLVSLEAGGVLDFEFNQAAMPEYRPGKSADYFQIRFADGRPYTRSASLGENDLWLDTEQSKTTNWYDVTLPNGHVGRAVRIAFVPQSEQPPPAAAAPMVAIIVRDRNDLDENLTDLCQTLLGAAVALAIVTALTSIWIVRRSLRPLHRVADQADAIDVTHLSTRLDQKGLPAELVPICNRLNELFARLEAAFVREKRFTSDVAHELRTPLAELRSISEVALKYSEGEHNLRHAISESLAIAGEMENLVNTLFALVRADQMEKIELSVQQILLASCIEQIVKTLSEPGERPPVEVSVPSAAVVIANPILLNSMLTNLLTNALTYATGNDPIRCTTAIVNDRLELLIENQASNLTQHDLQHLFEPFWRKDSARTASEHFGLGLSLVQVYCRLMNIKLIARFSQPGTLCMCLLFEQNLPASNSAQPSDVPNKEPIQV